MLPLHCKQCGRLIGRSEKHKIDGKTVCTGCFDKMGGNKSTLTPKQSAFYIGVILAGVVVFMLVAVFVVNWAMSD